MGSTASILQNIRKGLSHFKVKIISSKGGNETPLYVRVTSGDRVVVLDGTGVVYIAYRASEHVPVDTSSRDLLESTGNLNEYDLGNDPVQATIDAIGGICYPIKVKLELDGGKSETLFIAPCSI